MQNEDRVCAEHNLYATRADDEIAEYGEYETTDTERLEHAEVQS